MFKFASEGYFFIFTFASITLITVFLGQPLITIISFIITLFMLFFFRDPERITLEGRGIFYAPADGKVVFIKEIEENEVLHKRALEVSIFMSPLNVHVNRSPCEGTVKDVKHYRGKFLPAFKHHASLLNEHVTMVVETENGIVVVRQVAGYLARRIVCRAKPGDLLRQGQRYGIIKFGSRLDVFMPLNTEIRVKLHDKVRAGETMLGIID
ncbi:MAG: phosphatidylserine decarboxylase family protein [Thermodesulfovibrionia bacterium]|nr:phosphatidylserine decarboxylase family protein [Thermodesulfovibrionia bacterium]MCK5511564.1 phosphatidylserine decarboxylase family protein [Thermodesulfovibrionia bacterium]